MNELEKTELIVEISKIKVELVKLILDLLDMDMKKPLSDYQKTMLNFAQDVRRYGTLLMKDDPYGLYQELAEDMKD